MRTASKTIVTTDMACSIATKYGVELREVLTGFKFIGEQIGLLEQAGEAHRYVFGFEESCGYLAGAYARDKDAVAAVMLVCDMAYYYKQKGMTLQNALDELYKEHGRWETRLVGITFDGPNGAENMKRILRGLREAPPKQFGGLAVQEVKDYLCSERGLPKADVLEFLLEGRCKVIFRPSGTEPKVKAYISARADDAKTALSLCAALVDACNGKLAI